MSLQLQESAADMLPCQALCQPMAGAATGCEPSPHFSMPVGTASCGKPSGSRGAINLMVHSGPAPLAGLTHFISLPGTSPGQPQPQPQPVRHPVTASPAAASPQPYLPQHGAAQGQGPPSSHPLETDEYEDRHSLSPSPSPSTPPSMDMEEQLQEVATPPQQVAGHGLLTRSSGAGATSRRTFGSSDERMGSAGINKSSFRGVSFDKKKRKWRVQIKVASLGKSGVSVGYFDTEEQGARAYDRAAIGLLGRDNCSVTTNFPLKDYADQEIPNLAGLTREMVKETLKSERAKQAPRRRVSNRQRTSHFMGVGSSNRKNQWQARILVAGKVTHLGYYETEEQAAHVYDRVALSVHGESAQINYTPESYHEGSKEFEGMSREELQRALGVKPMDKSSQYRGVSRKKGKWEAKVMVDRKWAYRELFDSETEAAHAYDAAVWRLKPREAKSYVNFKERALAPAHAGVRKPRTAHRMSVSISPDDVTGADHGVLLMDSQAQDPISTVCLAQECVPGDVLSAATQMSTGNEMPHAMAQALAPKLEPMEMDGLVELGQGPEDRTSSLASSPERHRFAASPVLPQQWAQDGLLACDVGLRLPPASQGLAEMHQHAGLAPASVGGLTASALDALRIHVADGQDAFPASCALPTAMPLSLQPNPLVKTASDFNDAIASSPSFAAMLAHLPSDPSLLLRSGSLGSLQLLQGSGGSANAALLAELQALAAANDTATPLDLGTDMTPSMPPLHSSLTPTTDQMAVWEASAAAMLHQSLPLLQQPFAWGGPHLAGPMLECHPQPPQDRPIPASLQMSRSASADDIKLATQLPLNQQPEAATVQHWEHASSVEGLARSMALAGATPQPVASALAPPRSLPGQRMSHLRPVSAPMTHKAMQGGLEQALPDSLGAPPLAWEPSTSPRQPPRVRIGPKRRGHGSLADAVLTNQGLVVSMEECISPLTAHVHIGGEEVHVMPYEHHAARSEDTEFLLEGDLGTPCSTACASSLR